MKKNLLITIIFSIFHSVLFAQDGSLDTTFNVLAGFDSTINDFALQPDGKIVVGGNFSHFNGIPKNKILRLNSDGSLDSTFHVTSGFECPWSGVSSWVIYPLYTLTPPDNGTFASVNSVKILSSGKILVAGNFYRYNQKYCGGGLTRLNSDGSLDTTFIPGNVAADTNLIVYPYGVGLPYDSLAGLWQILLNTTYTPSTLYTSSSTLFNTSVNIKSDNIFKQADGKIIVHPVSPGSASMPNIKWGYTSLPISCFRIDGNTASVDPTFTFGNDRPLAQQTDGKIIISGGANNIYRINTNGSNDTTFNMSTGADNVVNAAVIQPDYRIIIGGSFTNYDGTSRKYITRINTDRSLDNTFNIASGFNYKVNDLALQTDGKIIVVGNFTTFQGGIQQHIARLNSDGSIDIGFVTGIGFDNNVDKVLIQPDGKILVKGIFSSYNGITRNKIARLNGTPNITAINYPNTEEEIISIFPSPTSGLFTITSKEKLNTIDVLNIYGKIVFSNKYGGNNFLIDIGSEPSGMYIVRVNDSQSFKIIKK